MNAGVNPIFLDTNILVYASVAESPRHRDALAAVSALEQSDREIWISRQVLREYLTVLSRPQTFTQPVPIQSLVAAVRFFQTRFRIAEDGPHVMQRLLVLLEQIPVGGAQIHDANIVATMQAQSIGDLLTHNPADFKRFAHLITILPLQTT